MKLLKIGNLDINEEKWIDCLYVFETVTFFEYISFDRPCIDKNLVFVSLKLSFVSKALLHLLYIAKSFRILNPLSSFFVWLIRLFEKKQLKAISQYEYHEVYVSYSDFDYSSFLLCLIRPYLKKGVRITRAYKETRNTYDYLEYKSFIVSDRIVLNDIGNKLFFEQKFKKKGLFDNKIIVFDVDEDWRESSLPNKISFKSKKSLQDGKRHAVILAGRVLSNPDDKRSGSRLYYVDLIKELLKAGVVVHLQAKRIVPYNGYNPYLELQKESKDFFIENTIDFSKNELLSYSILSEYDFGILHAHCTKQSSYLFDRVNIPHRYYAYHLAHVVPIDKRGENIIIDKKASQNHAIVYENIDEIVSANLANIVWDMPSLRQYFETLYNHKVL